MVSRLNSLTLLCNVNSALGANRMLICHSNPGSGLGNWQGTCPVARSLTRQNSILKWLNVFVSFIKRPKRIIPKGDPRLNRPTPRRSRGKFDKVSILFLLRNATRKPQMRFLLRFRPQAPVHPMPPRPVRATFSALRNACIL